MQQSKKSSAPQTKRTGLPVPDQSVSEEISSSDRVAATIYNGIFAGRYVPGQKLIEADLAMTLGLSRGPIREALKRLAAEGVVELTRHKGGYIRAMSRQEAIDLLEIVEVLTDLIVRKAAKAAVSPKRAKQVREAFDRIEKYGGASNSNAEWIMQRDNFYDTLIRVGENSQMDRVLPKMRIHLLRLQAEPLMTSKDHADRLKEYEAVTTAILKGDPRAAQRAMRTHLRRMMTRIERLPERAFNPYAVA